MMFKNLSLESRNIQTQNCTPIQCKVWPRNEFEQIKYGVICLASFGFKILNRERIFLLAFLVNQNYERSMTPIPKKAISK